MKIGTTMIAASALSLDIRLLR